MLIVIRTLSLLGSLLLLTACSWSPSTAVPEVSAPTPVVTNTRTSLPTPSHTSTASATLTAAPTSTPTLTSTPTVTPSPTIAPSPTITPTPAYSLPAAVVTMQAHCRYGPSKAYLHAADLYSGDRGEVWGRFPYSNWLQVKFEKLTYPCWVSPSVIEISGDISGISYVKVDLVSIIPSVLYGPPTGVRASRSGSKVTISWNQVVMTLDDDRGYFIEAWVCQNGAYLWWTVSFPDQYTTTYTVQDDSGCSQPSRGEIRTVEKHGYTEAVKIPWP